MLTKSDRAAMTGQAGTLVLFARDLSQQGQLSRHILQTRRRFRRSWSLFNKAMPLGLASRHRPSLDTDLVHDTYDAA
jgi:hypothetical protein